MSSARDRTLAHAKRLVAAAAVLGVGEEGCKKELAPRVDADAAPAPSTSVDPLPTAPPVATPDPSATAESTADTANFLDAGTVAQKRDAGKIPKQPDLGYRVVDPLPPPTRLPKVNACDPPYTYDSQGHRHYKPECLK